jgi:hypothetical protein
MRLLLLRRRPWMLRGRYVPCHWRQMLVRPATGCVACRDFTATCCCPAAPARLCLASRLCWAARSAASAPAASPGRRRSRRLRQRPPLNGERDRQPRQAGLHLGQHCGLHNAAAAVLVGGEGALPVNTDARLQGVLRVGATPGRPGRHQRACDSCHCC